MPHKTKPESVCINSLRATHKIRKNKARKTFESYLALLVNVNEKVSHKCSPIFEPHELICAAVPAACAGVVRRERYRLHQFFQVTDTVVRYLDLFLQHGHVAGKAIVLPHLPRQIFKFCVRHGLRCGDFVLCSPGGRRTGNHYPTQL